MTYVERRRSEALDKMGEEELMRIMNDLRFFPQNTFASDNLREYTAEELRSLIEDYTDAEDFLNMLGMEEDKE